MKDAKKTKKRRIDYRQRLDDVYRHNKVAVWLIIASILIGTVMLAVIYAMASQSSAAGLHPA